MLKAILPITTPTLRAEPGVQASGSGEPALQVSDLEIGRGARVVLRGVSFSAARGERLAILGPSGAGKSTLLLALASLTRPLRGRVTIDGRAPRPGDAALMFQSPLLFPWLSVLENVTFGLDVARSGDAPARRARARELLAMVGLAEAGARRPSELSGGERQRVALARALAVRPRVLLLDEPFSALDPVTRARLREDVAQLVAATGTTLLLVTHDREDARALTDRVLLLDAAAGRLHDPAADPSRIS
ncbi:ABC transporter ATP-binding protein [Arenimonas sp.]|uniref:ABC transporter ATP-binding protein n=1 Tax=Arenimonas sp. TaxID=1872635 RepID=UPI001DCBFAF5|nr:ABC transporter ATP-binding protein [Arenimonas sp.]MBX9749668.1 ABC transporter ATP-binding protein [Roseococcus sp.]